MPVSKSRSKHLDLVGKVAQLLEIDCGVIFLDAVPLDTDDRFLSTEQKERRANLPKNRDKRSAEEKRANKKTTLRIWTGNMDSDEKDRIRGFKMRVKTLAAAHGAKIAMSDRHPLGDDGAIAFEDRRRTNAKNKWKKRKGLK